MCEVILIELIVQINEAFLKKFSFDLIDTEKIHLYVNTLN